MIKIHTDNQQKALSKVSRYTNGYQNSPSSTLVSPKPPQSVVPPQAHHSPIKKGSPGVDRSRPLPPIAKEQPKNFSSSRSSPIPSPVENFAKTADFRSKSVDLEQRNRLPIGVQNGRGTIQRNGNAKPVILEPKQVYQSNGASDRKSNQDTLTKLKQAELQRLRTNTKPRDESPLKNGTSGTTTARASSPIKKPVRVTTQAIVQPKPKPKAQVAPSSFVKKTNPIPSKPRNSLGNANQSNELPRKPPGPGQEQCNVCGRNFNKDRIEKHRSICKKAASKKVKVFDATKMRVKGTEAEQFVKKGLPKAEPKPKKSNWRKQHGEFIEAIRQAKMVQQHLAKGGKVSDLPPPPPSDNSDYVPCPYCGRKFNEGVAQRHIPKCKNILSNKKNSNARK
uniref:Protein FAM164C n=1 Tax=Parasteatoda tepidariorum TaxID=114398 RepID=A0A2L2YBS9_PARTP